MYKGKKIFAVIMAAGKGTRIGATDKPKVMFEVAKKPIIGWSIQPLEQLKKQEVVDRIITVVGFHGNQVIDYLGERSEYVWQREQLGTGHAVKMAENLLADEQGYTIIVNGDHALYTAKTYRKMIESAVEGDLKLGFAVVKSPTRFDDYGRVLRDKTGKVLGVVERPEASQEQRKIAERSINLFIVDNRWLFQILPKIKQSAVKKEYYIVDIVKLAIDEGLRVEAIEIEDEDEALGINTHENREETEKILLARHNG